jgi:tRNA-Thr(GGU) m(6)t(6)A37 methyltransferase TsaA
MTGVELGPIGWVSSPRAEPIDDDWDRVTATICLDTDRFGSDALRGLDEFSHVEVVYLFDRVDPDRVQTAARRPRGNLDWPEVGIFAQRAKARPNRIGVSVCRLLAVDGLTVTVQGLDAIDETPVLDIKPYMSEFAARGEVRQPAWSHQLMAGYWTTAPPADPPGQLGTLRRSYDTVADVYAAEIAGELAAKPLDRALLDAFGELCAGGPVADLGAGPGHVGGYLAAAGTRVVSFDLSGAMCRRARADFGLPPTVADLACLPVASDSLAEVICFYALIHLGAAQRAAAYREIARVTRPDGLALIAFHTSDIDAAPGGVKHLTEWWGRPVELTFRFLDPGEEAHTAHLAGLDVVAHLYREPDVGHEHPSRRSYLLLRKTTR